MSPEIVTIIRQQEGGKGEPVEAILHTDLNTLQLVDAEIVWSRGRLLGLRRLIECGALQFPQHVHWNWGQKAISVFPLLAYRFLGIEVEGMMQGLMMACLEGSARLDPDKGKPLVYVEYLETAPWNAREFTDTPRFKNVGVRLMQAAARLSVDEGFAGRVGLHSLEQTKAFYAGPCGMQSLGPDGDYEYFELTAAQATKLLGG